MSHVHMQIGVEPSRHSPQGTLEPLLHFPRILYNLYGTFPQNPHGTLLRILLDFYLATTHPPALLQ